MNFLPVKQLKVGLQFAKEVIPVGRLAIREHKIYFEYDAAFTAKGMEISPITCPLRAGVQSFADFSGLPGVCNDSLPDGWGSLLLDRKMRIHNIMPKQLSPLDRLAHVGHAGMGALVYDPHHEEQPIPEHLSLDMLAWHAQNILQGETSDVLQQLLTLNGSSGGARPKVIINVDASKQNIVYAAPKEGLSPWLLKFANSDDNQDSGAIEYVYSLMAKDAGIEMAETHLFPAENGPGYFATKCFDRNDGDRLHMHSACGLLHSDYRVPSLDYEDLIALTTQLTKDIREAEKMFHLAVFNVLAHNRDDHSKNFSFLMGQSGEWKLSPAYDLTFSHGINGEQSTMVMGEGKNPSISDVAKLGKKSKIPNKQIDDIIGQTESALSQWKKLATEHGVSKGNINSIAKHIKA